MVLTRCTRWPICMFLVFFVVTFPIPPLAPLGVSSVHAAVKLSDQCHTSLKKWRKDKARNGAFAVASNGACGFSWNEASYIVAERLARQQCRKRGRNCKITHKMQSGTIRHVFHGTKPNYRPRGRPCRRAHDNWLEREGFRVFVTSGRGLGCHYNSNASSIDFAFQGIMSSCEGADFCQLYEIAGPEGIHAEWQKALKNLGYYAGALDARFGPGTLRALDNFSKDAGETSPFSKRTFDRLLWGDRIHSEIELSIPRSIKESRKVTSDASLEQLKNRIRAERRYTPTPSAQPPAENANNASEPSGSAVSWSFTANEPGSFNARQSGLCVLTAGELEFAFFGGPDDTVIALSHVILDIKPVGNTMTRRFLPVSWRFGNGFSATSTIKQTPEHGRHILVDHGREFFVRLATSNGLILEVSGEGSLTMQTDDARLEATKFLRCMQRSLK